MNIVKNIFEIKMEDEFYACLSIYIEMMSNCPLTNIRRNVKIEYISKLTLKYIIHTVLLKHPVTSFHALANCYI